MGTKFTGLPWTKGVTPEIDKNSFGGYAQRIGEHYLSTQEVGADAPGTGEWRPDFIPTKWWQALNKIAKSKMEQEIRDNSRSMQVTEFLNWLSPSSGAVANRAAAHTLNNINLLSEEERDQIGSMAVGAWGLQHQQQEMHTRGLQQYINKATGGMDLAEKRRYVSNPYKQKFDDGTTISGSDKQFTGAPLTMEDVRAATIWHIDPEWAEQEDE